jgi:hypothetical protein
MDQYTGKACMAIMSEDVRLLMLLHHSKSAPSMIVKQALKRIFGSYGEMGTS